MPPKIYINIVKISLKNSETSQISYTAKSAFEIWEWGKMHLEYKLKSNQQKESQIPFPNKIKVDIEIEDNCRKV